MNLMSSTKQCISAVELSRRLGASDPTAWFLYKRLRHAMTEEADRCRLGAPAEGGWTPIVEADDVYLGGERNEGRGTAGKTRVIATAKRHPSGRHGGGQRLQQRSSGYLPRCTHRLWRSGAYRRHPGTFHVFGESGRTEEVVDAVLFLASARAS